MYAISESSSIYHRLYSDQDYTLCGFRAEQSEAQILNKGRLRIVDSFPLGRRLCKQCDKMSSRRKMGHSSDSGKGLTSVKKVGLSTSKAVSTSANQRWR